MAIEAKKVVELETQGALKSLADLRKQINDTKNELYSLKEGSEEYNDKLKELGYAQDELSSFMALTRQGCAALEGSYNALSYLMSLLKLEYKATADEARRNELAELISGLNDKLKDMDAAVGVFSRNVGNYTGAMNDVFGKLGINVGNLSPIFNTFANSAAEAGAKGQTAMQGLSAGAQGLGKSLKALIANPVGAVIMGIVLAVQAMKAAFDAVKASVARNEEAQDNLKKAMAPIKAIIDGIRNAFDNFIETLTKVAAVIGDAVSSFMQFIGIAGEAAALESSIAKMEQENDTLRRKNIVENARLELEASEAKAKAAEKDKRSTEERLALINEYASKQKEIAANNLEQAQAELKLLEAQAATGKNNAEMNDKLAQAQAKVLQVLTAYNNTLREANAQVAALTNAIEKDEVDAQKKAADAAKKTADEIANMRKQFTQLTNASSDSLIGNDFERQRVQAQRAYDEEIKQYNEMLAKKAISQEEYNKAVLNANNALYLSISNINKAEQDALEEFANNINRLGKSDALNSIEDETRAWYKKMQELDKAYADGLIKNDQDYWNARETLEKASQKAILKVRDEAYIQQEQDALDKTTSATQSQTELELNLLEERYQLGKIKTMEYIQQSYELKIQANNDLITAEEDYRAEIDRLYEEGKLSKEAYDQAVIESDTRKTEIEIANIELAKEANNIAMDSLLNALGQMMDTMSEFASNISSIGDGISSKWSNVFSGMSKVVSSVGDALKSNEKGFAKWAQVAAAACSAVSSMFGALADEQDENSEEGFEAAKKFRYAEALFSMASGIMSVWPAAMQLGPIAGPIMGGILSAMITGMGIAQMAQISKTKYGDTNSASATPSSTGISASIQAPVQYSAEVVPNSMEGNMPDSRVYVLESDISDTQRRVNVAENESRY